MKTTYLVLLFYFVCASCSDLHDDKNIQPESKKVTERYIYFEDYEMKRQDKEVFYNRSKEPLITLKFKTNFPLKTKVIVAKTLFFESADNDFHPESIPEIDTITINSSNFTIPYSPYYVTGGFKLSVYPSKEDTILKQPFHSFYSVSYKLDTIKGHERIPLFPLELIIQKDQ